METFLSHPDVVGPEPAGSKKTFGSSTLRVKGKIFAMLVDDALVVKLPQNVVDELVDAGAGQRFDSRKGQPMKEWLQVDPTAEERWLPLAEEALEFVGSKG